uniref:TAFII55_N domain-containing protein n=1 Tax=Macrostomum lignano TaxID=282301 RepID=A0A1I8F904_9PLAT
PGRICADFTLTYDGETLPAGWLTCPAIVEGLKTADSRTFYKWDHGLTPHLRNVRRRRFRRVLRNRSMEMPELEKEVKRAAEKTIWKRQMSSGSRSEGSPRRRHRKLWTMQQQSDDGHSAVWRTSATRHRSGDNEGDIATNEEGEGKAG